MKSIIICEIQMKDTGLKPKCVFKVKINLFNGLMIDTYTFFYFLFFFTAQWLEYSTYNTGITHTQKQIV